MATGLLYQRNNIEIEIKKENWCEEHWVPVPKEDTIRDLLEEVAE